jgi:hypothetical protein
MLLRDHRGMCEINQPGRKVGLFVADERPHFYDETRQKRVESSGNGLFWAFVKSLSPNLLDCAAIRHTFRR